MDGCLDRYQVKPTHKQTEARREEKWREEEAKLSKVKAKTRTDGNQRAASNEREGRERKTYR